MKLLLDTHVLLWSADDPGKLSVTARKAIEESSNDRLLSAATIWELAIKFGQGKICLSLPYHQWMQKAITDLQLKILPITIEFAAYQAALPPHHKDPFDRLLVAQAIVEAIPLVSADPALDAYGVTRLW